VSLISENWRTPIEQTPAGKSITSKTNGGADKQTHKQTNNQPTNQPNKQTTNTSVQNYTNTSKPFEFTVGCIKFLCTMSQKIPFICQSSHRSIENPVSIIPLK
jgi:hypothetical protein